MNARYLLIAAIGVFVVFLTVFSAEKKEDGFQASRNGILLRKIGHDLLLSSGDESSRVMPVQQLSPTAFRIRFQNQLSLLPDSIISIVKTALASASLPKDYSVSMVDCNAKQVVYGFAIANLAGNSAVPCSGRPIPMGCYYIDLTFSQADTIDQQKKYGYAGTAIAATLLIAGFALYQRKKKNTMPGEKPVAAENDRIRIGKYDFYFEQHYIESGNIKTTLTNKESKLLYIFAASINEVIDRNVLQEQVWGNEGVIVTRSLDMFVSKLRKKLQDDPAVKIINFPGKGYKLEVVS